MRTHTMAAMTLSLGLLAGSAGAVDNDPTPSRDVIDCNDERTRELCLECEPPSGPIVVAEAKLICCMDDDGCDVIPPTPPPAPARWGRAAPSRLGLKTYFVR